MLVRGRPRLRDEQTVADIEHVPRAIPDDHQIEVGSAGRIDVGVATGQSDRRCPVLYQLGASCSASSIGLDMPLNVAL
jgi:hypothetical protein